MKRKPTFFDKISNFVTGKGFYLAVLACVAVIGLSAFYLFRTLGGGTVEDQPVTGSAVIVTTPTPLPTAKPIARPTTSPEPTTIPTPTPTAAPEPAATPKPTAAALVFTWPVNGPVITSYSVEALAYDETMDDWRTHAGIDISAEVGCRVLATAAGTVSAVYEDDLMGTTVEIDHGSGLVSVYSNLSDTPAVGVGDPVSTGTLIGAVGTSAAAESGRSPHLHFAMLRNNVSVDPERYLPEK